MNIQQVHPTFVCQVWPRISSMLSRALEHAGGEYSLDQLQFMLVRGEQYLLVVEDGEDIVGAASVAFQNYPSARIAFITAVGGKLISNQEVYGQLVDWCKANGCTKIRGAARESIARLWKQKFGFEQRYIIVEQQL